MSPTLVEVCCESLHGAMAAQENGADRIELNAGIELGGLTPTLSLLRQVKAATNIPVICMVRPRGGNFYYSSSEFDLMQQEARLLIENDADGLAFGILNPDLTIDHKRNQTLIEICGSRQRVFHRAFDCSADLSLAISELIHLKFDRVLTSGGQPTAMDGADVIQHLIGDFGDQIEVLPGSGIRPENAVLLVKKTGCRQIHGTFQSTITTGVQLNSRINFHPGPHLAADEIRQTDGELIQKTIANLKQGLPTA
ncbi:MAG: copper homeostasis protein CutC [Pirellulaceae bacterium]|nr:copper homeostasis protein CutC [Pirellulaceae bacterium]